MQQSITERGSFVWMDGAEEDVQVEGSSSHLLQQNESSSGLRSLGTDGVEGGAAYEFIQVTRMGGRRCNGWQTAAQVTEWERTSTTTNHRVIVKSYYDKGTSIWPRLWPDRGAWASLSWCHSTLIPLCSELKFQLEMIQTDSFSPLFVPFRSVL